MPAEGKIAHVQLEQRSVAQNCQAEASLLASEVSTRLCAFTQIFTLNKYANLHSTWKSLAAEIKQRGNSVNPPFFF